MSMIPYNFFFHLSEFQRLIIMSVKKCCLSSVLNRFSSVSVSDPEYFYWCQMKKKIVKVLIREFVYHFIYTSIKSESPFPIVRSSICSLS